jgi:hypothetical protein
MKHAEDTLPTYFMEFYMGNGSLDFGAATLLG